MHAVSPSNVFATFCLLNLPAAFTNMKPIMALALASEMASAHLLGGMRARDDDPEARRMGVRTFAFADFS